MQLHERRRDDASEKIPSGNDIVSGSVAEQSGAIPNSSILDQLGNLPSRQMALSEKMQNRFNERFGTPMTGLKVFSDEGLSTLGQTAYARGNEIHLDSMTPMSSSVGENTMMHEAAHVVQQGSGLASGTGILQNQALEAAADKSADMSAEISAPPAFSMPTSAESAPIQGKKKWHTESLHEFGTGSSRKRTQDEDLIEMLGNERSEALTSGSKLHGSEGHNGTLASKSDTPAGSGEQTESPAAMEAKIEKILQEKRQAKAAALEAEKQQKIASLWEWAPGYEGRKKKIEEEYNAKINKKLETEAQRKERLEGELNEKRSSRWTLNHEKHEKNYAAKLDKRAIEKKMLADKLGYKLPESTASVTEPKDVKPTDMPDSSTPAANMTIDSTQTESTPAANMTIDSTQTESTPADNMTIDSTPADGIQQEEAVLAEAVQQQVSQDGDMQQESPPAGDMQQVIHGDKKNDKVLPMLWRTAKENKDMIPMGIGMGAQFATSIDHESIARSGEMMSSVDQKASNVIPGIGKDGRYNEVEGPGKVKQAFGATGNSMAVITSLASMGLTLDKANVSKAGGNEQAVVEGYFEATRHGVEAVKAYLMALVDTGVLSATAGTTIAGIGEVLDGALKAGQGIFSAVEANKTVENVGKTKANYNTDEVKKNFSEEQQKAVEGTMNTAISKAEGERTQGIFTAVDGVISIAAGAAKLSGVGVAVGMFLSLLGAGVKAAAALAKMLADAALIEDTIDEEMGPKLTIMIDGLKAKNPELALRADYDDFEQIAFKQLGFASGTREEVFQNIILNRVSCITAMANNLPEEMKGADKNEKEKYAHLKGEERYRAKYKDWDKLDEETKKAYRRRKFTRELSESMGLSKVELSASDEGYETDESGRSKKKKGYSMQGMAEKLGMEKGVRWQEQLAAKRDDAEKLKRSRLLELKKEEHMLEIRHSYFKDGSLGKTRIAKDLAKINKKKAVISGSKEDLKNAQIKYYKEKIAFLEAERDERKSWRFWIKSNDSLDYEYGAKIAAAQQKLDILTETEEQKERRLDALAKERAQREEALGRFDNKENYNKLKRRNEMLGKTTLQKHQLGLNYEIEDEKKRLAELELELATAQEKENKSSSVMKWIRSKLDNPVYHLQANVAGSRAVIDAKQWLAEEFDEGKGNPEVVKKLIALNAERQAKMENIFRTKRGVYNDYNYRYVELVNSLRKTNTATETSPDNEPEGKQDLDDKDVKQELNDKDVKQDLNKLDGKQEPDDKDEEQGKTTEPVNKKPVDTPDKEQAQGQVVEKTPEEEKEEEKAVPVGDAQKAVDELRNKDKMSK